MKKHKRRKTKQFSLIKISKHTKMEFLSQSNSCSISDSFLDEYTEDEACNRFDITKNVWIKISHVVSHGTIFQYLENDISLDEYSFPERSRKLSHYSRYNKNRLIYRSNKNIYSLETNKCYH